MEALDCSPICPRRKNTKTTEKCVQLDNVIMVVHAAMANLGKVGRYGNDNTAEVAVGLGND